MASDLQASASVPPPKPWERTTPSSGPTPFKPPSSGSTSNVVEASGTAKPGEFVSTVNMSATATAFQSRRTLPARPWEQQNYTNTYTPTGYNSGYNPGLYGSSYGGYGGSYSGGLYGNNGMYGGGYAGGMYGNNGLYGGGYGGGMYTSGFGGLMGANGRVMVPHPDHDPNGAPAPPPAFWVSLLQTVHRVVTFCGTIAMLVDENTRSLHTFMSALLMLLDVSGSLYGELARLEALRKLARFVFGILGIRRMPRRPAVGLPPRHGNQSFLEGPSAAVSGTSWDTVWGGQGNS